MKISKQTNNGITLIALVITIIVLLILAGVSIATLTSENGILTKANTSKYNVGREHAREKVQISVMGSYDIQGNIDNSLLKTNLDNVEGIKNVPIEINAYPITVTVDGYEVIIGQDGSVTVGENEETEYPDKKVPEVKIGDYVSYTFDILTQEELSELNSQIKANSGQLDNPDTSNNEKVLSQDKDLKWRVLEKDNDGNITKLISANETGVMGLYGANGYNNSVYLLNNACNKLYSGEYGIARSIKIEDLEKKYSKLGVDTKYKATAGTVKYGETRRYTKCAKYPKLAEQEVGIGINTTPLDNENKNPIKSEGLKISEQEELCTLGGVQTNAPNGITITQTYYNFQEVPDLSKAYSENIYYNLFHEGINIYWIASRVSNNVDDLVNGFSYCGFGTFLVTYNEITANTYSCRSTGGQAYAEAGLRPIISLKSGVKFEYVKTEGEYNIWNLSK